jgi:predicted O-linked N-acetylglucosamine transferase (SPINDLY family)
VPSFYLFPTIDTAVVPASTDPGGCRFVSCNNPAKIVPAVIRLWARILDRVPGSTLTLKYADRFGEGGLRKDFEDRFARHGVATDRVRLLGGDRPRAEHLEWLGGFDVALDPFPFNGASTSFEALWMGLPVVSLAGERFVGRVGASLLSELELPELLAATEADYVAIARRLAGDPGERQRLRQGLRPLLQASRLCDPVRYTASLEAAYRQIWRDWCLGTGHSPRSH